VAAGVRGGDADPVEAARRLVPLAADTASQADANRRLAPELVEGLRDSGLLRMLVPSVLGGGETTPAGMVSAVEELARADGAAGWCLAVAATSGVLAGYLPREEAREVFGDPRGWVGGVFAPKGRAKPTQAGELKVSGRWPFASGVDHCDWLMGGCLVEGEGNEGDGGRRAADGPPDTRLALVPAHAVSVIDTWEVAGLRATGSHDFEVDSATVPEARTVSLISDEQRADGPLYAFPVFGLLALAIAAVGTGIARGAVDDLVELAGGKVPAMATRKLADHPDTQIRVARAEAALRAARALVGSEVAQAWEEAVQTGDVDMERRAGLRMAASHAMSTAAGVVDEMYRLAGGGAVYAKSPLQRRFRDVHVATQHMLVNPSTWEFAGRVMLGAPVRADQF
jgi:alkylation response protein AidB-like acyl-CoA dehydrogenase